MKRASASGNLWVSELWGALPLTVEPAGSFHRHAGVALNVFDLGFSSDEEPIERSHAPTGPPPR